MSEVSEKNLSFRYERFDWIYDINRTRYISLDKLSNTMKTFHSQCDMYILKATVLAVSSV